MNKKVFIAMLILTISFLVSFYVLKIFFPQEFVMSIQNEQLIKIGTFIDTHKWAYYLFGSFTSFVTYYLYCCAVCKRLRLKWYECLIILATILISIGLTFTNNANLLSHFNVCSMFILPLIFGGKLKETAIVFSVHGLAQILTLGIRNLPIYIAYYNSLIFAMLTLECYFWLILFYIIFNYKQKEN